MEHEYLNMEYMRDTGIDLGNLEIISRQDENSRIESQQCDQTQLMVLSAEACRIQDDTVMRSLKCGSNINEEDEGCCENGMFVSVHGETEENPGTSVQRRVDYGSTSREDTTYLEVMSNIAAEILNGERNIEDPEHGDQGNHSLSTLNKLQDAANTNEELMRRLKYLERKIEESEMENKGHIEAVKKNAKYTEHLIAKCSARQRINEHNLSAMDLLICLLKYYEQKSESLEMEKMAHQKAVNKLTGYVNHLLAKNSAAKRRNEEQLRTFELLSVLLKYFDMENGKLEVEKMTKQDEEGKTTKYVEYILATNSALQRRNEELESEVAILKESQATEDIRSINKQMQRRLEDMESELVIMREQKEKVEKDLANKDLAQETPKGIVESTVVQSQDPQQRTMIRNIKGQKRTAKTDPAFTYPGRHVKRTKVAVSSTYKTRMVQLVRTAMTTEDQVKVDAINKSDAKE